jgi:5'-nucleotidase
VLITDDVAAVKAAVAELQREGIDKIIALTHVGYQRDVSAIAQIPGVDVVVGGHSHTLLSNTDKSAAGPYPTFAGNLDGYKVPVVTAASYSKLLGEVTVTFDDKGVVKEAKGDPIPLDAKIAEDPQVVARVKELAGPIEQAMSKVVAEATAPIDGSREACRAGECAMGDLVADAMLDRTKKQGVAVAITNGGGLRASISAGPVTLGDVVAVLPFQNTLSTFQLSGKDIVAALENGVSQVSAGAGRFPQVAGLRYSFDRSIGPNSGRVKSAEVKEGDSWQPLDPDKLYLVVSNNYMRAGGDGYAVLRDNAKNAYDYGPDLADVLTAYLQAHRPYSPFTDGRIKDATPKIVDSTKAKEVADNPPAAPAKMPDLPAASEELTTTPPPADKGLEQGSIKLPDLPAMSQLLATKPPLVETDKPANGPAAKADGNAAPLPDLPSASATIANEPPRVTVETKPAVEPASPAATTHVIVTGDNYWNLAKALYGDPALWHKIAEANPAFRARALPVGEELKIPAK